MKEMFPLFGNEIWAPPKDLHRARRARGLRRWVFSGGACALASDGDRCRCPGAFGLPATAHGGGGTFSDRRQQAFGRERPRAYASASASAAIPPLREVWWHDRPWRIPRRKVAFDFLVTHSAFLGLEGQPHPP